MSWHRRLPVTDNVGDRGELRLVRATIENKRFDCCGLSLSRERRSSFVDCVFRNLRLHRCSMGAAIFERCHFENIWVSDGPLAHGAVFLECRCRGSIRGVNFGFSDAGGIYEESMIRENLRRAVDSPYCLDLSEASCTSLAFAPGILAQRVRFRERQCLVLSANNLAEIAGALFRSTKDKNLQLLLVGASQVTSGQPVITLVEEDAQPRLDEYMATMARAGIEVRASSLC